MAKVEIYTWATCPFCIRAKALLDSKGINFTEHKIDGDDNARGQMALRAGGRRSVPQVFIDDKHIGGYDDLQALDKKGELDRILKNGNNGQNGMHPT